VAMRWSKVAVLEVAVEVWELPGSPRIGPDSRSATSRSVCDFQITTSLSGLSPSETRPIDFSEVTNRRFIRVQPTPPT